MTSTIITEPGKELGGFPKLMEYKSGSVHMIVLFTSRTVGFVVSYTVEGEPIGYHYTLWNDSCFVPFTGTIQLRND